jgi:3-oxoadipate enol-lactonase
MPVLTITRYCCLSLCVLLTSRAFTNAQNPNREGLVSAGKLQVHYEVHGAGAPLVFVHAGYQDLSMWDQQVTFFKKFNTVITVDMPGHGGTTGVDTSLLVQDVLRILLDSLHIQTASFAGLSMGGACVTDFVLAYPERVNKVVLVSSGLSGWSDVLTMDTVSRQCFGQMDRISASNNLDSFASAFCKIWCIGLKRNADAVPAAIRDYVFRTTLENLKEHSDDGNRWPQMAHPPAADRMQQWQKPLLIITGDQDLPFIAAVATWIHMTVKGSTTVVIPHTAHMLNMENPLLFNKTVHSFLQD